MPIKIHGKDYVEVHERITEFRSKHPGYCLESQIINLDDKHCVIMANIYDENQKLIATGLAREVNGEGKVNKTSYVENCETSAWGRALGNFGIGIESAVASADEVKAAVKQQKEPAKKKPSSPLKLPDVDEVADPNKEEQEFIFDVCERLADTTGANISPTKVQCAIYANGKHKNQYATNKKYVDDVVRAFTPHIKQLEADDS